MSTDNGLYERLGGRKGISRVTEEFYRRVLEDPLLSPLFAGVDMTKLTGMQVAFLSMATGGPDGYAGRDLRTAHVGMDLDDRHFDRVVALLAAALKAAGVSDDDIGEVAVIAETVRADVLGR